MTGFRSGKPPKEGRYKVIQKWEDGCNVDGYDYTIAEMYFINGSWWEFWDGGHTVDSIDYEVIAWQGD